MASLWIEWINPVHHLNSIYCISACFTSLLEGQGQDIKVPDGRHPSTAHCTGLALLSNLSNEVSWQRIACTAVRLHLTKSHHSHIASLATLCTIYFALYMLSYHNNNILITLQWTGHWSYPGWPPLAMLLQMKIDLLASTEPLSTWIALALLFNHHHYCLSPSFCCESSIMHLICFVYDHHPFTSIDIIESQNLILLCSS